MLLEHESHMTNDEVDDPMDGVRTAVEERAWARLLYKLREILLTDAGNVLYRVEGVRCIMDTLALPCCRNNER